MDFYSRQTPFSPMLGIEEGESRKTCPPGTVKSYLPEFPWSECIPEEQALAPRGFPSTIPKPGPTKASVLPPGPAAPSPVASAPPPPPPLPAEPRKARFLKVDVQTGNLLDPETGALVESASVYSVDTVDTVAIGAGIGLIAILLTVAGVFE